MRSLLIVDLPDDFGPQINVVRPGVVSARGTTVASFLFHIGGDMSSCTTPRLGASSDENSLRRYVSEVERNKPAKTYHIKSASPMWP